MDAADLSLIGKSESLRSFALRQLRRLRGAAGQFQLRLWLDYAQVRGPLAFGGRQRRQLIWGNDPAHLQRSPNLLSYEISNLVGGNVLRQQFDWYWPLPLPLLVGDLAACRRAESWHTPPALDFDLRFAAGAPDCLRASSRRMLPRSHIRQIYRQ